MKSTYEDVNAMRTDIAAVQEDDGSWTAWFWEQLLNPWDELAQCQAACNAKDRKIAVLQARLAPFLRLTHSFGCRTAAELELKLQGSESTSQQQAVCAALFWFMWKKTYAKLSSTEQILAAAIDELFATQDHETYAGEVAFLLQQQLSSTTAALAAEQRTSSTMMGPWTSIYSIMEELAEQDEEGVHDEIAVQSDDEECTAADVMGAVFSMQQEDTPAQPDSPIAVTCCSSFSPCSFLSEADNRRLAALMQPEPAQLAKDAKDMQTDLAVLAADVLKVLTKREDSFVIRRIKPQLLVADLKKAVRDVKALLERESALQYEVVLARAQQQKADAHTAQVLQLQGEVKQLQGKLQQLQQHKPQQLLQDSGERDQF